MIWMQKQEPSSWEKDKAFEFCQLLHDLSTINLEAKPERNDVFCAHVSSQPDSDDVVNEVLNGG